MDLRHQSGARLGNETLDSRKSSQSESRRASPGLSSPNFYAKFLGKLNLRSGLCSDLQGFISFNAALALSARSNPKVCPKKLPRIAYYCQSSRYNRLNAGICMQELSFCEPELPRVPRRVRLRRHRTVTSTRPRRQVSGCEPLRLNAVGTPILTQAEGPVRLLD